MATDPDESERNSRLLVHSIPGLVALLTTSGEVDFVNARRTIRDANRASAVIERLRALFRRTAVTTDAVDLNDAIREGAPPGTD